MSQRVRWDEQETAILVDFYNRYKRGECTRKEAIRNVSIELRNQAIKRGLQIDDKFRNENGIKMQMEKIEDLFLGGKNRLSKAPQAFANVVNLYLNDRESFDGLLRKARGETDGGEDNLVENKDLQSKDDVYLPAVSEPVLKGSSIRENNNSEIEESQGKVTRDKHGALQPDRKMEEAALMLAWLIRVQNGEVTRSEAARRVSNILSKQAVKNGMQIDGVFKEKRILWQMLALEAVYKGEKTKEQLPKVFLKTVNLYKNKRNEYEEILRRIDEENEGILPQGKVLDEVPNSIIHATKQKHGPKEINKKIEKLVTDKKDKHLEEAKPWEIEEAVLMLDWLVRVLDGKINRSKAIEQVSNKLRKRAIDKGIKIGDKFRNKQEIFWQMLALKAAYNYTESITQTQRTTVFSRAVDLYKNHRNEYEKILKKVKTDEEYLQQENIKQITSQALGVHNGKQLYKLTSFSDKKQTISKEKDSEEGMNPKATSMANRGNKSVTDKDKRKSNFVKEEDFFSWLSSAGNLSVSKDVQKLYKQINVLLIKSGLLPQPLTDIISVDKIEIAIKNIEKTFANKFIRSAAKQLLTAYEEYLRKQDKFIVSNEESLQKVDIPSDWIKYDFKNAKSFERTYPVCCEIAGAHIEGKNWARILVNITEQEINNHNPAIEELYKKDLFDKRKNKPYLMEEKMEGLNCAKLSNGYWVCLNYSIPRLIEMIRAICLKCGYSEDQIVLYGRSKISKIDDKGKPVLVNRKEHPISHPKPEIAIDKMEEYIYSVGIQGATVKELIRDVQPDAKISLISSELEYSKNIVAMPGGRYVHIDNFVDLNEAEKVLGQILQTHFLKFDGYSNDQLLFGAAAKELSMFLNDNNCQSIDAVYAIARFLFEKKSVTGLSYTFSAPHIFKTKPNYPMTLQGLMIQRARNNGGLLYVSDAKAYLKKIMIAHTGINKLLRIRSSNTFLMYNADCYLLSESLKIDSDWCIHMHNRLDDLFRKANVAYVIPRDISAAWLNTLPSLPQGLKWTLLLLQEVLDKYPDIGFKSIFPKLNQTHDTLAAALVPKDSQLQNFPDVVTLYMEEHHNLPMRFAGEELRKELRKAGMLENNELLYYLPKALNDFRFAWSNENKTVYVRGNR